MKCVFIVNPKSGNGKILKYKNFIISNLKDKYEEIQWVETEYSGHAKVLAEEYGEKVDTLFFSGGDGTLNEIVNGVLKNEKKPVLAQIPSGTVNDFSGSLGIKKNIKKSLKQLLSDDAKLKEVDVFKIGEKYGVYICGFGIFTKTSYDTPQEEKKKIGWLAYLFHGIREMKTFKPQLIDFVINGEEYKEKVVLALLINSRSVGGFKFNKRAKLDDGQVDMVVFKTKKNKLGLGDLIRLAKLFVFGIKSIEKSKKVIVKKSSNISIKTDIELALNFDGELAGGLNEFNYEVKPKAIKFLVPKNSKPFLNEKK